VDTGQIFGLCYTCATDSPWLQYLLQDIQAVAMRYLANSLSTFNAMGLLLQPTLEDQSCLSPGSPRANCIFENECGNFNFTILNHGDDHTVLADYKLAER
jgi:hypothetical protein